MLRAPAELCFRSDESKQKCVIAQTMKAAAISIPFIRIIHKMKETFDFNLLPLDGLSYFVFFPVNCGM